MKPRKGVTVILQNRYQPTACQFVLHQIRRFIGQPHSHVAALMTVPASLNTHPPAGYVDITDRHHASPIPHGEPSDMR